MCEPVEQCGCHLCVAKYLRPFTEAEVGRDDDTGALIEFAQKVEQQCAAGRAEWQVAKLVEDDEVDLGEHLGHFPGLPKGLFLLQRVDQFDGRIEAHFASVMLDGLDTDSCSDMAFASAGPSDQNDVFRILYELTAMELSDRGLIDVARREVKTREVLVGWEACDLRVIGNGSHFPFGHFRLEQFRQHWGGRLKRWNTLCDQVIDRMRHAVQFEAAQHDDNGSSCRIMTHCDFLRPVSDRHSDLRLPSGLFPKPRHLVD